MPLGAKSHSPTRFPTFSFLSPRFHSFHHIFACFITFSLISPYFQSFHRVSTCFTTFSLACLVIILHNCFYVPTTRCRHSIAFHPSSAPIHIHLSPVIPRHSCLKFSAPTLLTSHMHSPHTETCPKSASFRYLTTLITQSGPFGWKQF